MSESLKEEVLDAAAAETNFENVRRMMVAFSQWEVIREHGAKERKRCTELVASRLAQFKEAMEVGHATQGDQLLKLSVVEQRWQDLEDARTEKKEVTSAMKDQLKGAEQKIRDLISEAKGTQMSLFGGPRTPTIDMPPIGEDDDDDLDTGDAEVDEAMAESRRLMAEADEIERRGLDTMPERYTAPGEEEASE